MTQKQKNDDGGVAVREPTKAPEKLKRPRKWAVILLNDDYTTFEFVSVVCQKVFRKSYEESQQLTKQIHAAGSAAAGIYTKEIAETKASVVGELADAAGFPLRADLREM